MFTYFLRSFCEEYEYPQEACTQICDTYHKIRLHESAYAVFRDMVLMYEKEGLPEQNDFLNRLDVIAEEVGANPYTTHLLYLICLTPHLKVLYRKNEYNDAIFHDSVLDLKWKLQECWQMHNVWGVFVSWWHVDFFRLKLFALGRLQFELTKCKCDYSENGIEVHEGDIVVNVHIPSGRPLKREEYTKSYELAAEFFAEHFADRPVVFVCNSWFLNPDNVYLLPETSSVLRFAQDYHVVKKQDTNIALWRIFHKEYHDNPEEMPQDTSLQRALVSWLKEGKSFALGYGIFFYKK